MEWHRSQGRSYEDMLERLWIWMPRVAAHCNYHAPAHQPDGIVAQSVARPSETLEVELDGQKVGENRRERISRTAM